MLPRELKVLWIIFATGLIGSTLAAQEVEAAAPRPAFGQDLTLEPGAISQAIAKLRAEHGERVTVETLCRSRADRPIEVLTISLVARELVADTPTTLVVAGLQPGDEAGVIAAMELAARLAIDPDPAIAELLATRVFLIVALLNPDLLGSAAPYEIGGHLNGEPDDRDQDRKSDEDGAIDQDGDGQIMMMRIADRAGEWLIAADPLAAEDQRLMRKADKNKGEVGAYRLEIEASDQDGDGKRAEDGIGSTDLTRSFPAEWSPAHRVPGSGHSPLLEPEARALIDRLLSNRAIGTAYVLGGEGGQALAPPHAYGADRIPGRDRERLANLARDFAKLAGLARSRHAIESEARSGTLLDWLYLEAGATPLFIAPWQIPATEREAIDKERKEKLATAAIEQPVSEPIEERLWLIWCASHAPEDGFAPWRAFTHPQLGEIEIGGWRPLGRAVPPPEFRAELGARIADAIIATCDRAPQLMIETWGRRLDDRVDAIVEVRASVANLGLLPTATERAIATRRAREVIVEVRASTGELTFHLGSPRQRLGQLDIGERSAEARWLIAAPPDAVLEVVATSERGGRASAEVTIVKDERK